MRVYVCVCLSVYACVCVCFCVRVFVSVHLYAYVPVCVCLYLVPGPAHDGGKDGSGSVVSGKSGFAETGSVIADQSGALLVITHDCRGRCRRATTLRHRVTLQAEEDAGSITYHRQACVSARHSNHPHVSHPNIILFEPSVPRRPVRAHGSDGDPTTRRFCSFVLLETV